MFFYMFSLYTRHKTLKFWGICMSNSIHIVDEFLLTTSRLCVSHKSCVRARVLFGTNVLLSDGACVRLAGGYSHRSSSNSNKSPESGRASNSEEMVLFKKVNKLPQPPPAAQNKEFGSASSVTLGYGGDSARKPPHHRTNSVSGTRERIANMIARR